jgi:uncharacterized protein YhfF
LRAAWLPHGAGPDEACDSIAAAVAAPAQQDPARMSEESIRRFWEHCRATGGLAADTRWRVRRLGDTPEMSGLLLDLIRRVEKTGTFTLLAEFAAHSHDVPEPGEYFVITDFAGEPGCCVPLARVEVLPFDAITSAWTAVEGPALRELGAWREVHVTYWTKLLAGWGREWSRDTRVVCQQFGPLVES